MKIQLGIILTAACLAVAGCGGNEEAVVNPGHTGVGESVSPPNNGTEASPPPVSGEDETDVVVVPPDDDVPSVATPPEGLPDGDVYRPDFSRYFGRFLGLIPLSPEEDATLAPHGTIAMPAPTRVFRLTSLEWIPTGGAADSGGHSKVLSCFDKTDHPTGVLAGFIHQYSGEGNILGMRGVCEDVAEDGRIGQAAGVEGIVASLVADVTELVGSGDPYYWRRCDLNEGGVGISQQRLTATTERLDKLDLYCAAGETGPRFDPSNHTGSASAATAASCPDGKFMFGVVVRYDWRGIRAIDAIGCAKTGWVSEN